MSGLIGYPARIWLAVEPVGLRRGIDGLSSLVQQVQGHSPGAGSAFVFRNRAGNPFSMDQAQWQWLIAGVDWQRLTAAPSADWQV